MGAEIPNTFGIQMVGVGSVFQNCNVIENVTWVRTGNRLSRGEICVANCIPLVNGASMGIYLLNTVPMVQPKSKVPLSEHYIMKITNSLTPYA